MNRRTHDHIANTGTILGVMALIVGLSVILVMALFVDARSCAFTEEPTQIYSTTNVDSLVETDTTTIAGASQ